MQENEGYGLDYERYALGKLFHKMVKQEGIQNVLEIPAGGIKAMPSIYSIALGEAGCHVTLANANPKIKKVWEDFGFDHEFVDVEDLSKTKFDDNSFDLVWNYAFLPISKQIDKDFQEMIRVSRNKVMLFFVNGFNVGFPSHNICHKMYKVPWTHGNRNLFFYPRVKNFFKRHGLKNVKSGFIDTPLWPDSLGFRDMKYHKMEREQGLDNDAIDWHSSTLDWMKNGGTPNWIKLMYAWERLPLPPPIKIFYAHIAYVIGEKQ